MTDLPALSLLRLDEEPSPEGAEATKRLQRILGIKEDGEFRYHTDLAVRVFKTTFMGGDPAEPGVVTPEVWDALLAREPA